MTSEVLVSESWTIGGYEVDPHDSNAWRKWREKFVAARLEDEVKVIFGQCQELIVPIIGDHRTPSGFKATLLLEEARVNLWGHGKDGNPSRQSEISFRVERIADGDKQHHRFLLRTQDDKPVFNIENLPDLTYDENLCQVTGRGILLIRRNCRAIIRQTSDDAGGKFIEYEWRDPEYSLSHLGLPEDPTETTE